ncbi:hypothetical protein [Thermococcus sp. Bubb.Bath]|uniref:hypothetical protein n=1 Tax=Thermococcus sp. Bubb.Bath TaxID=1638242 RepID=UPI00143C5702|nr:hypothetical protein [Thermococcus sp. Bubb.Bath]NJF25443.1 hypothetical protein [Thermococcus sp. Bubb.Bath]
MDVVEVLFYIEIMGRERDSVEMELGELSARLKRERFRVKRIDVGEVIEDERMDPLRFSSIVEVELEAPLDKVFRAAVAYSPTMVEVFRPGRIEIAGAKLSKILQDIIGEISTVMKEKGVMPSLPKLDDVPMPPIGFDEEELWEMIYEGRNILSRLHFRVKGEDEKVVREILAKALLVEGCGVNSLSVSGGDGFTVEAEVVSSFESLVGAVAKYLPDDVQIIEPEVVDITLPELQNSLSDLGSISMGIKLKEEMEEAYERDVFSFRL